MPPDFFESRFHDGWNDLIQKYKRFDSLCDEIENDEDGEILNPSPFKQLRDARSIQDALFREPEAAFNDELTVLGRRRFFASSARSVVIVAKPQMVCSSQFESQVTTLVISQNSLEGKVFERNARGVDDGRVELSQIKAFQLQ